MHIMQLADFEAALEAALVADAQDRQVSASDRIANALERIANALERGAPTQRSPLGIPLPLALAGTPSPSYAPASTGQPFNGDPLRHWGGANIGDQVRVRSARHLEDPQF
jgi:hypothetical protein